MPSSLLTWVAAAVLLFWTVGAYNRLVRLRGEANAAFASLDSELARQVQLVNQLLTEDDEPPASVFDGIGGSFWGGLQGAASQLEATLAAARQKPLDPDRIAALAAAQSVLATAWERAERFTQAVHRYNAAIAQFPAVLLALLFGFKPGRGLEAMPVSRGPAG